MTTALHLSCSERNSLFVSPSAISVFAAVLQTIG